MNSDNLNENLAQQVLDLKALDELGMDNESASRLTVPEICRIVWLTALDWERSDPNSPSNKKLKALQDILE